MVLVKNRRSHEGTEVMKHELLQKAVSRLRGAINNPNGMSEPLETDLSALALAFRATQLRSCRFLEMGGAALAGRPPKTVTRIAPYEEVLTLINRVADNDETWCDKDALLVELDASQEVVVLLTELAEQPCTR